MHDITATYSPEDNKLRLYTATRLGAEEYARVKAAGFKWAPKQDLFVAPAWTPERADLCEELAGEITDEDTSLVDRAEERAERFEEYAEHRDADYHAAHKAVSAIADNIPLGQPILVGHHSERRARKDAERIQRGMERAVNCWETARYWEQRAKGAVRAAKYKERPDVRARRIKGLEADERKQARMKDEAERFRRGWTERLDSMKRKDGIAASQRDAALFLANHHPGRYGLWSDLESGKITVDEARERAVSELSETIDRADRWLAHLQGRLAYERAMLADAGGTVADRAGGPEVGGGVRCWATGGRRGDHTFSWVVKVNKVSVTVYDNWQNGGANFTRTIPFDKLSAVISRADVEAARDAGRLVEFEDKTGFAVAPEPRGTDETAGQTSYRLGGQDVRPAPKGPPEEIQALRAAVKEGVQVVSAPQLFPTPRPLARRLVDAAGWPTLAGKRVLEPSAGTGNLVRAVFDSATGADNVRVVAIEQNPACVAQLEEQLRKTVGASPATFDIRQGDFLACNGDLGLFDAVVANPPFKDGADIAHILHARTFLKPDGKLAAICADGPRQNETLKPLADTWEPLPEGSFEGTNVRTVLLTMRAAAPPAGPKGAG